MRRALLSFPVFVFMLSILPRPAGATWWVDGVPVCNTDWQASPVIVSDGAGGAIIAWRDARDGAAWDIYVQRIDASGDLRWMPIGVAVCTAAGRQESPAIASDGAGGAIVAWQDGRDGGADIYARRVDDMGNVLWTADGVAVTQWHLDDVNPRIASDGAGGAIVTWNSHSGTSWDIAAQRIDGSGNALWGGGTVLTSWYLNDVAPQLLSDGTGGAFITWISHSGTSSDIVAQRIDGSGNALWGGGIVLTSWYLDDVRPQLVSDGTGGAVIIWRSDSGTSEDIVAQRIDGSGNALWGGGVVVCASAGDQMFHVIVSDGSGGAIIAWEDWRDDGRDIYVSRVGASGNVLWAPDGLAVCTADNWQLSPTIVSDGAGGAIVAWEDDRRDRYDYDMYAQRVNDSGSPLWTADGVALCTEVCDQKAVRITSDGAGGAITVWEDHRIWCDNNIDPVIYAQRVTASGSIPTAVVGPTRGPSTIVGEVYPNPFTGSASMDLVLSMPSSVRIDVFDLAGRTVRVLSLHDVVGPQRIEFDGRDNAGRLLASGVYFCRVDIAGQKHTRKMVIAR